MSSGDPSRRRRASSNSPAPWPSFTPLIAALSRDTSTATGSMSVAMHLARATARARRMRASRCPVPISAIFVKVATVAREKIERVRQPAVVACWPVPKARPASISKLSAAGIRAVRRRVDEEAAGADRLQSGLAHRHPVRLAELLDVGAPLPSRAGRPSPRRSVRVRNKRGSASRRARLVGLVGNQHRRIGACRQRSSVSAMASACSRVQGTVTRQLTFRGFLRQPLVEPLG